MSPQRDSGRPPIGEQIPIQLKRLARNEQLILSLLAAILGAMAGLSAIAFRMAITGVQWVALGFTSETVASQATGLPWWRLLFAPTTGGLLLGLFVYFLMPGRRPQGVAQVIEANALSGGHMSLVTGLKSALVNAASIGVGASVGREGPVVHLGASLGSWLSQRLRLTRIASRTLLGCGIAATVATSFNAPIAGAFFALEVVLGHYRLSAFAPIVIASVTGTIVSRTYYGDHPAFVLPELYGITSFLEFPAFALLGIISAIAAILFMHTVMFCEDLFDRLKLPPWSRPAIAGLAVGVIALAGFPHVLGVGYEATDSALSELYPLWLLLALIVLKTAATALCLGSGFGGGVFSPSLFLGAMVGGAYGVIATSAFPDLSSGYGTYTIIGMGAVAGAILGAPISTILMIFELTGDYAVTIAVMIATVIASAVTQLGHGRSFFAWQLERLGVTIESGRNLDWERSTLRIDQLIDTNYETIHPNTPINTARERLVTAPGGELLVVTDTGHLTGTLTLQDLAEASSETCRNPHLMVAEVARRDPPLLELNDDLGRAVTLFRRSGKAHLPVVTDRETLYPVGFLYAHAVMTASYPGHN